VGRDPTDKKFVLVNNSSNTISYYFSKDTSENSALEFYSEKFYRNPNKGKVAKEFDYIKNNKEKHLSMMGSWESYLNGQFKNGEANLYIIDSIDIGKDYNTIKENKLIKKYKVSFEYMKAHNWRFEVE
jgi:hypothetical protein